MCCGNNIDIVCLHTFLQSGRQFLVVLLQGLVAFSFKVCLEDSAWEEKGLIIAILRGRQ